MNGRKAEILERVNEFRKNASPSVKLEFDEIIKEIEFLKAESRQFFAKKVVHDQKHLLKLFDLFLAFDTQSQPWLRSDEYEKIAMLMYEGFAASNIFTICNDHRFYQASKVLSYFWKPKFSQDRVNFYRTYGSFLKKLNNKNIVHADKHLIKFSEDFITFGPRDLPHIYGCISREARQKVIAREIKFLNDVFKQWAEKNGYAKK